MKIITAALGLIVCVAIAQGQEPELRIASDDFREVASITVREGHVYVADKAARAVFVFDERGAPVRVIGREGRGPMEFRRPDRLGWLGDTLWVRDTANQRFTLIDSGSEVGTVPLSYQIDPSHEHLPPVGWGEWLLTGGALVIAPIAPWNILAQGHVISLPHIYRHRDDSVNRILFERDVRHEVYGFRPQGAAVTEGMFAYHPFASGDVVTVPSDGSTIYIVNRGEYRVTRMSPSGRVLWSRRYPFDRRPADTAIEEFASFMVDLMGDAQKRGFSSPVAFRRAVEDGLTVPEHLPPVSTALAAPDGSLWVRREAAGSSIYFASPSQVPGQVEWDLLDADGHIVGLTRLPIRFEALHAEGDAIWGVLRDEMGVPTVVKYRLNR